MKKFYDSRLYQILTTLSELMLLNLLTVLCSVPVVTAGASISALYSSLYKLKESAGTPAGNFFSAFKKHFKRATLHWLLLLFFLVFAAIDLYIMNTVGEETISRTAVILPLVLTLLAVAVSNYLFALIPVFRAGFGQTIRIAVVFSIKYFPRTVIILILNAIPYFLLYYCTGAFLHLLPVWLLIAFSLIAYETAHILTPVINEINSLLESESEEE